MKRSALTIASVIFLVAPAGASGQTFAGGSIGGGSGSQAVGASELGFRVNGSRITVRGAAIIGCRRGRTTEVEGRGTGTINSDGTFAVRLRRRLQLTGSPRFRRSVEVSGVVRPGEVVGRLRATGTGGGVRGCRGAIDYVARQAPALGTAPGPPVGGSTLLGTTSGSRGGPFGVVMHVVNPQQIGQFITTARYTCRRLKPYQETNYSPPITIAPDGTFRKVERFRVRFSDVVDRVTITTTGRFVDGGASGTWQARSVSRSRRTGRVVDRCGTGRLNWSAAVASVTMP